MSANLIRKASPFLSPTVFRLLANLYPPFLAAGIRVRHISADFMRMEVNLVSYGLNLNYVGTHFGGSLYSMTDPWFMLILLQQLGKEFIVWDKGARIDFKKPGTGRLTAVFEFTPTEITEVRRLAQQSGKYIFEKQVEVRNQAGEVVTVVDKILYVRKK